jgi:hypothetical protein
MRRVIWSSGDLQGDPDVYVTTMVNFGEKLAECITIAATRETIRLFGSGKDDGTWFLMERT